MGNDSYLDPPDREEEDRIRELWDEKKDTEIISLIRTLRPRVYAAWLEEGRDILAEMDLEGEFASVDE